MAWPEDVTSSCELGIIEIELSIHSSEICSHALLDKYVRQNREREAGNEKHSYAEHRVWIFDRDTCSIGCFVLRCGTKRFLTLQLLDFRSSLDRIVHLPVPSENVSRRGKKISESLAPTTGTIAQMGAGPGALQRKIKKIDPAKESGETRETSEVTKRL
jgi:hypothetical protein